MALQKIKRKHNQFSEYGSLSGKKELDENFDNLVDRLNEVITFVNNLEAGVLNIDFNEEGKFLYIDKDGVIKTKAITMADVLDFQVKGSQIAPGSLTSAHLAPDSIEGTAITDYSIPSTKIQQGSILGKHLAGGIISSGHIKDLCIGPDKIQEGILTGAHIKDHSITPDKLSEGVIPLSLIRGTDNTMFLHETTGSIKATFFIPQIKREQIAGKSLIIEERGRYRVYCPQQQQQPQGQHGDQQRQEKLQALIARKGDIQLETFHRDSKKINLVCDENPNNYKFWNLVSETYVTTEVIGANEIFLKRYDRVFSIPLETIFSDDEDVKVDTDTGLYPLVNIMIIPYQKVSLDTGVDIQERLGYVRAWVATQYKANVEEL